MKIRDILICNYSIQKLTFCWSGLACKSLWQNPEGSVDHICAEILCSANLY